MSHSVSPWGTRAVSVLGVLLVTAYVGLTAWAATRTPYDIWIALLVLPLLVLVSVPMLLKAGHRDPDPRFIRILMWAFVVKILATAARYGLAFWIYGGPSDAAAYHNEGTRLAIEYRAGNFSAELGRDFIGTGFIRALTGGLYAVTGPSMYLAFGVFALLAFWGTYFLYRAFRVAVPGGDARRYAFLVLFLPSMLYWPSSLGKEAFMILGIGLFAYGSAQLLSGYHRWPGPLVIGVLMTGVVRPHVTAALFVALGVAFLLRRRPTPATELTPLVYVASAVVLAVSGLAVVWQAASFLNIDGLSVSSLDSAIDDTAQRTDTGGSSFESTGVDGLADLPLAAFSVLFRPTIVEASNPQMLLAAAESALLMLLVVLAWRSLVQVPGRLRREPYLIMCLVYVLLFIFAFSNFSNFGMLTRQRVQVLPFVLVFLALRRPPPTYEAEAPDAAVENTRQGAST
ncbi:hypothetical protein [Nocardioides sp. GXQ0305]|uniref:hypothetical protein n=1 Tax=Nocardioides sp. GXQ0305 TaxID=3423912 RepID=UPI003D7F0AA9